MHPQIPSPGCDGERGASRGKLRRVVDRIVDRSTWIIVGVVLGGTVTAVASSPATDTLYRNLQVLAEVLSHVENFYVDSVSPQELIYGAASGAVDTLDPHSMFFDPEQYRSLVDATEGEYAGIGVEIDIHHGFPHVIAILDGSPALKAGLQRADVFVAVDGEQLEGTSFDQVQRMLRGPVGTKVVLTVRRKGVQRLRRYTLVRSWIRISPIQHEALADGVHYVKLMTFPRRVAAQLDSLLRGVKPKGLVLDMRNNPGGLFDEAVEVCDLFLKGGSIVTATGKGGRVVERRMARDAASQSGYPMAILIDQGSASAAEVVAGALHDRGRARLFGARSYGKGSVQSILDLSDGSGLKLTIARYVTPSGRQIDGHGIEPDEAYDPPTKSGDDAFNAAVKWIAKTR